MPQRVVRLSPDGYLVAVTVLAVVRRIWQLWPGQGWPFSHAQEQEFVHGLRILAGADPLPCTADRDSVSALLVLLRCGTPLEEARRLVPGLTPDRMLAAYELMDGTRQAAVSAWRRIASDPSAHCLLEHAELASLLVPLATHLSLSSGLGQQRDQEARRVVREIDAEIERTRAKASSIEESLSALSPGDSRGIALGSQLYNPMDPGLYSNPFYLPDRVSSLSPIRVRDLLGEARA